MKKRFAQNVALLMSLIMLFSAFAGVTAFAQTPTGEVENVETAESVIQSPSQLSIGQNNVFEHTFTTFADLKTLVANKDNYMGEWIYVGTDPFVFAESIDLAIATVSFPGVKTTIPAGVTVSGADCLKADDLLVEGAFCAQYFTVRDKMTVTGTLTVTSSLTVEEDGELTMGGALSCGNIWVYGTMNITSPLQLSCGIYTQDGGQITGTENITFTQSWYNIQHWMNINDSAELKPFLEKAAQSTDSRESFRASIQQGKDISVLESVTIPANCELSISTGENTVTLAENVTLTNNGTLSVSGYFQINGTLENNAKFNISAQNGGQTTMGATGSYTGRGEFSVSASSGELFDYLVGFDMNNFKVDKQGSEGWYFWNIKNIAGLEKLAAPSDLRWGYMLEFNWDQETQQNVGTIVEGAPGTMVWKNNTPTQNQVLLELYRVGETEDLLLGGVNIRLDSLGYQEYGHYDFVNYDSFESGDYYVKAYAVGDGTVYTDSDPAVSEIWHYEKPEQKMPDCTDITWNLPYVSWNGPDNREVYELKYYFAKTLDDEPRAAMISSGYYPEKRAKLFDFSISRYGTGYYYVSIRAISANIEEYDHGDWSELSEPCFISAQTLNVGNELNDTLGNEYMSTEEKLNALQNMDNQKLTEAMNQNNTLVDYIAKLEEEMGGAAAVEVTEDAKDFDVSKIGVVGANLNTAADAAEDIKLVVDKPEKEHVIPEAFHNAVAVSFSMNLENVADPHNLEVPVEITLPIPADMNPAFIVIVHYDVDGNYEQISPYIYNEGGQYYASFVVSGFSDFMMVSQSDTLKGDLDNNGIVDDEDVIYLLWHTLMSDDYPVNQPVDFDSNGIVDDEDVIYLLWHTLMPKDYPL